MSFILRGLGGLIRLSGVAAKAGETTKAAAAVSSAATKATTIVSKIPTAGAKALANLKNIKITGVPVAKSLPTKLRPAASEIENVNRLRKGLTAVRTTAKSGTAKKIAIGTGAAAAAGVAATTLRSSATARTVAKTLALGGGLAAGALAAGAGIEAGLKGIGAGIEEAVVQPFEELGLVQNTDTDGDGVPDTKQLTTTGKVVVYGAIAVLLIAGAAYIIGAVKK